MLLNQIVQKIKRPKHRRQSECAELHRAIKSMQIRG